VSEDQESLTDDIEIVELDEVEESRASELRMDEVIAEDVPPAVEEEIDRLRAEHAELKDAYLRLRADFDNSRKRMEREKSEYYRFALGGTVRELLPVLDNLDRALAMAGERDDEFIEGVRMIRVLFEDVLQKLGVTSIGQPGDEFDPNFHEAVSSEERPDLPPHSIIDVLQKGYVMNDRLIRPAMVRVALGGDEPATQTEKDDAAGEPEVES
jgi:molecular chaperone GrpE